MIKISDEQLVLDYLAGEEKALRTLFERYVGQIYNFVFRYVGRAGDAEDITQDTFLNAWRSLKKFDTKRKFKTWIFTIAKNSSLNWIKKKKPTLFSKFEDKGEEDFFADSIVDPLPLPDKISANSELKEKLKNVLQKLNPNYRIVLMLRYENGFNFREIAESLKEPIDTIKSRHRRALLELRKLLVNPNEM